VLRRLWTSAGASLGAVCERCGDFGSGRGGVSERDGPPRLSMALKEFAETSIRARAAFSDMICARRRGRGAAGPRRPRAAAPRAPARRPPPAAGAAPRRATHTRPRIRRRPGRCRAGGRGRRAPRRRAPRRRATRCRSSPAPFSTTRAPPLSGRAVLASLPCHVRRGVGLSAPRRRELLSRRWYVWSRNWHFELSHRG
jgi:hypothetical protein